MTNNEEAGRGATEAQLLQVACGVWCNDRELAPLQGLLKDERKRAGLGRRLRQLFELHQTTPEQIALETCIAIGTLKSLLDNTLIPDKNDELMRIFVAAVVRDQRRAKINALLELAGYYQLLPPLPPLVAA